MSAARTQRCVMRGVQQREVKDGDARSSERDDMLRQDAYSSPDYFPLLRLMPIADALR